MQKTHTSLKAETVKPSNTEVLGKRKQEDKGIAKFLTKKEESTLLPELKMKEGVEGEEIDMGETFMCSKCQKHIPLQKMEEHEDYHMALGLSKGSPIRAPPPSQLKTKPISKDEKKGPKKKTKPVEKGQRRLEFAT